MEVLSAEWKSRIDHWIRVLKEVLYEPLGEITWEARRVKEHITPEEALVGEFKPVEPGFAWGNTWEYCWFRGEIVLPEHATGKRIVMALDPGGESTLFVNGRCFGTYRSDWVFPIHERHHLIQDNCITRCAVGGERFEIFMETYAGHHFPESSKGSCATGPVLGDEYEDKLPEGARRILGSCTYGIWNEDAYQLYMDVETLRRLLEILDPTSLRAAKIAQALETFTLIVDFEQDQEVRAISYCKARELLKPVLEAENGGTQPTFYAVGNAHIDLAWLWPMAETHRKTARTFAAQLRLLEEYPEYRFIQSQPAAYEMCRKYYPELFERLKQAIRDGRWIADGAMWVEPDTNIPSGESLVRQLLYGKKYYKEEFNVDCQIVWLPDTFGYTAALPQILAGCGVKYLVTQKIFWSYNESEAFPYHYFKWRGMDGTEVISFLPTCYTYKTDPVEINNVWKNRSQVRDLEAFLLPFGYGDGGGGPSRDFIEYALRQKNLEGGVKVKLAGPMEFFEDMKKIGEPANTYVGELYFTAHRGTYTSQAMVKKNNRTCEFALRELELWAALAAWKGNEYPHEEIEALWKEVLLYQFHDILPGSCIKRVYEEAEKGYERLLYRIRELSDTARRQLLITEVADDTSETVTVFNSLGFERGEWVVLPESFEYGAMNADGQILPVYRTTEGLKAYVHLPSCGVVTLSPAANWKNPEAVLESVIFKSEEGYVLENLHVRAIINLQGELISFKLKESGREFISGSGNCFHMYKDVPRLFDAWDIDSNYRCQETEGAFGITVEVVEQGAQAVLEVRGRIGQSAYCQRIRLAAESRRIEFETVIDWQELHRLLKVAFPTNVYAENGINEVQFGYVERPTHRSRRYDKDRFEVCNHKYSALCDNARGAAVLNDCKYGVSMNEGSLELTLLRASASPEMRADNRRHEFTYAFTAWEGDFAHCDVVQQGYELNVRPIVVEKGDLNMSFFRTDQDNIIIDTVKLAEDTSGDLIIRLYESKKAAMTARLYLALDDYVAYECDMLENPIRKLTVEDEGIVLEFKAFEVKTLRILKNEGADVCENH